MWVLRIEPDSGKAASALICSAASPEAPLSVAFLQEFRLSKEEPEG